MPVLRIFTDTQCYIGFADRRAETVPNKSQMTALPAGDWTIERIGDDTLVFACPDHEPMIYKNGKLEILKPLPRHMDF